MPEYDVCIVGGGVMGLAAAYMLGKESKQRILIIDRYGISNNLCSSNDINRVFRYAYGADKLYTQMAIESLRLWRELEAESAQKLLIPTGFLLMDGEKEEWTRFARDSYFALREMGLKVESLEESDLKLRYPQFTAERAILDPYAGALLASQILKTLYSLVKRQGISILEEEQVSKLSLANEPEAEISTGKRIRCRKLILTTGVWSNSLLRKGLTRITATRQQLLYFKPTTSLTQFQPSQFPIFFVDNFYGIPAVGIDGVKVTYHGLPDEVDPEKAKRTVDPEVVETCRGITRKYIPELAEGELVHSKVCIYDMTANSDFVIGSDPEYSDVIYGYGFSGHGFKFAPLIGKLLAELALERNLSFPLERFSPVR